MTRDHAAAMFAMILIALGAVAIILYQHAQATAQVLGAVGASGNAGPVSGAAFGGLGASASLAGTPIVGQEGSSVSPAVVPLNINPGYTLQ